MSSISSVFKTDKKAEKEGVIIDFGPFSVTVAHAARTNIDYKKMLEKEMRPHRRAIENGLLTDEASDKIMYKVYAHTIVIDWDGVTDAKGKVIPYSSEACLKEFEENPAFFDAVKSEAENFSLFKAESKETDLKN